MSVSNKKPAYCGQGQVLRLIEGISQTIEAIKTPSMQGLWERRIIFPQFDQSAAPPLKFSATLGYHHTQCVVGTTMRLATLPQMRLPAPRPNFPGADCID